MHMMAAAGVCASESNQMVFRYQSFARIFSFLGLLCLFTAMLSPSWVVIAGSGYTISVGLWSTCRNQTCRQYVSTSKVLLLIKVLISFSAFSGLVSVSCAFLNTFRISKAPLITNIFTGLLTLATLLLYYHSVWPNNAFGPSIVPTTLSVYLSWSFVLGCLGCFFFLLNGLLFALAELQGLIGMHDPKSNVRPNIRGAILVI